MTQIENYQSIRQFVRGVAQVKQLRGSGINAWIPYRLVQCRLGAFLSGIQRRVELPMEQYRLQYYYGDERIVAICTWSVNVEPQIRPMSWWGIPIYCFDTQQYRQLQPLPGSIQAVTATGQIIPVKGSIFDRDPFHISEIQRIR